MSTSTDDGASVGAVVVIVLVIAVKVGILICVCRRRNQTDSRPVIPGSKFLTLAIDKFLNDMEREKPIRQELRPIMSVVVKMLEGSLEVPEPGNPFQHLMGAVTVAHPVQESKTYNTTTISSGSSVIVTDSSVVCATPIMRKYEIELASSNFLILCLFGFCTRSKTNSSSDMHFLTLAMDKFLSNVEREKPIRFTSEQLRIATDNYASILGSEGFGEVYTGNLSLRGNTVAVKYRPESRPIMSDVVKMLEGSVEIYKPLNPFQHMMDGTFPGDLVQASRTDPSSSVNSSSSVMLKKLLRHYQPPTNILTIAFAAIMAKNLCSLYSILLLLLTLGDVMATVVGDRCKTDLGVCPAKNGCNAKCSKIHEGDLMATVVGDRCKTDLGVCPPKNGCNEKCSKIHQGGQGICDQNNLCMCNFDCKLCDVVMSDQLLGCTDISCTSECAAKYPGKEATGYCVGFGEPYTNCHCQYQC
ncbi:hypothetical protein JHK85_024671 [Glycine max]|nr:hypothetical protein JHK85_024671 [Glycine max]